MNKQYLAQFLFEDLVYDLPLIVRFRWQANLKAWLIGLIIGRKPKISDKKPGIVHPEEYGMSMVEMIPYLDTWCEQATERNKQGFPEQNFESFMESHGIKKKHGEKNSN